MAFYISTGGALEIDEVIVESFKVCECGGYGVGII